MTLSQAQKICSEIEAKYWMGAKWNDVFANEQELIEALAEVPVRRIAPPYTYKGYEFIHSYAKAVKEGKTLSDKMMVQAKRLAVEISKARAIKELEYENK